LEGDQNLVKGGVVAFYVLAGWKRRMGGSKVYGKG
jgi:hypothetical protein